jgi:AraC-like DNA-binding protein
MLARDVSVFVNALEQMGYDMRAVMAQSPLAGVDLSDPDKRVSCQDAGALIGIAMCQRHAPSIAAELASRIPIGSFPLLDYLVMSSDTVGAAIKQLSQYMSLAGHPATLTVREAANEWRLEIDGPPFSIEFSAALAALHLRREADGPFRAAIFFKHSPDDPRRFEAITSCPVEDGAIWNGVEIPRETLDLKLRRRDPVLRSLLETQANASLRLTGSHSGAAQDVARVLASRLTRRPVDIGGVARTLATTPRTLQRRLTSEGVSFQELVDEARRDTAARLLRESTLSIGEVAYLVGYSEPAPFHRAFKRWFGATPQDFRRQLTETRIRRSNGSVER